MLVIRKLKHFRKITEMTYAVRINSSNNIVCASVTTRRSGPPVFYWDPSVHLLTLSFYSRVQLLSVSSISSSANTHLS